MTEPVAPTKSPSLSCAATVTSTTVVRAWRRVVLLAQEHGRVAVTSNGDTQLVLVSRRELARMDREIEELSSRLDALAAERSPADTMRKRFLARIRSRDPAAMNAALRAAAAKPVKLRGRLKPGDRY